MLKTGFFMFEVSVFGRNYIAFSVKLMFLRVWYLCSVSRIKFNNSVRNGKFCDID